MQDLGTLGGTYSQATGINNSGQIVGYTTTLSSLGPTTTRAFLRNGPGNVTYLGTLGGANSQAFAVNDSGEVVGNSTTALGEKAPNAFLWQSGQMTDLGTLGGIFSYATAINDSGQIVGYSSTGPGLPGFTTPHAFLYSDGTMTDLNNLLPAGSGWELTTAMAINNQGAIVGMGYLYGQQDGYILYAPTQGGGGSNQTTTVLQPRVANAVYGESVTVGATVAPQAGASGNPSGTVTFLDGSSSIGTVPLDGASASLSITSLPAGLDQISARYSGDSQFAGSPSRTVEFNVQKDGTSLVVTCPSDLSYAGQPVTFTAVISPLAPRAGTATGTVAFLDGPKTLGTAQLSGGAASESFPGLALGTHSITAVSSGDSDFLPQTSAPLGHSVITATYPSETILASSAPQASFGAPIKLTATVENTTRISGTPTGTVEFTDGATVLAAMGLRGGKATLTTAALPLGSNRIWVYYEGDRAFAPSASAMLVETIEAANTKTRAAAYPKSPVSGQSVALQATVSGVGRVMAIPSGFVSFYDGGHLLGTVAVTNGEARLATSKLSAGTHSISMTYLEAVGRHPQY
jgi:probable HAF family extracellular repeat protein